MATEPPPHPFYERTDQCSLSTGRACLVVSAPGGRIAPQDAEDVVAWLELIIRRTKREAAEVVTKPESPDEES